MSLLAEKMHQKYPTFNMQQPAQLLGLYTFYDSEIRMAIAEMTDNKIVKVLLAITLDPFATVADCVVLNVVMVSCVFEDLAKAVVNLGSALAVRDTGLAVVGLCLLISALGTLFVRLPLASIAMPLIGLIAIVFNIIVKGVDLCTCANTEKENDPIPKPTLIVAGSGPQKMVEGTPSIPTTPTAGGVSGRSMAHSTDSEMMPD